MRCVELATLGRYTTMWTSPRYNGSWAQIDFDYARVRPLQDAAGGFADFQSCVFIFSQSAREKHHA